MTWVVTRRSATMPFYASFRSRECGTLCRMKIKCILPIMILAGLLACSPQEDDGLRSSQTDNRVQDVGHPGSSTAAGRSVETHNKAILPFIADDYATALAEAKRRDLPLFVENWAPW